jgi:hypothetical protein
VDGCRVLCGVVRVVLLLPFLPLPAPTPPSLPQQTRTPPPILPTPTKNPSPTTHPPTPQQAERALEAEAARVRAYLHGATEKALLPVVVEELLGKHVRSLVDRCVCVCVLCVVLRGNVWFIVWA